jgi:hypothetical protein
MQNLVPNAGATASLTGWPAAVTGSATTPVAAYSATSGPDNTPGLTLTASGTSGGVQAGATVNVSAETMLGLSVAYKCSSTAPTVVPVQVTFYDASGNSIVSYTPVASAAGSTSWQQANATVGVPDGAVTAKVVLAALSWAATGGYSVVLSTPIVLGY